MLIRVALPVHKLDRLLTVPSERDGTQQTKSNVVVVVGVVPVAGAAALPGTPFT
jgi:hypothetical protein